MMTKRLMLNGDDWTVTGFWTNQWRLPKSIELAADQNPAIPPIKAKVPGAVNLDLLREGLIPDPNIDLNSNCGEWVSNRDWIYYKEFTIPEFASKDKYYLHFEGLDYHGEIWLNGQIIKKFTGMFIPLHINVTDKLKINEVNKLQVIFYQPPEVDGQFGYTSQIKHLKSRFNYKWDWCPRIIPVGIWDDVYLEAVGQTEIVDFYPRAILREDNQSGRLQLNLTIDQAQDRPYRLTCQASYQGKLIDKWKWSGLIDTELKKEVLLENVKPWWPVGYGEQPLYQITVNLYNGRGDLEHSQEKTVGFKRFKFVSNQNASEDALPYTLIFNGKRIFLQGINWVPISPFYGEVTQENYHNYLARFKAMNCNIVRVWGGAIVEKEEFYQTCDQMGLLVWQEFFQSSSGIDNCPSTDPKFLRKLKEAATWAIKRRRHHTSLVVWCGGNELFLNGIKDPVGLDHPNIKMLNKLVQELDPDKQFYPASPSGPTFQIEEDKIGQKVHHDVHGPWRYLGDGKHNQFYNRDDSLLRSETGTPGTNSEKTLRKIASKLPVWPPNKSNLLWKHHGDWWIQWQQLSDLFGPWNGMEDQLGDYVKSSQYLQAESLRYAVESVQRRQPEASGIIIWMGNEPYANTANTSLIEYNGQPKPVYGWLRRSFAPVNLSCKYNKVGYQSGEQFQPEIYLHDSLNKLKEGVVRAGLYDLNGKLLVEKKWQWARVDNSNVWFVGSLDWTVAKVDGDIFLLRLELETKEELVVVDTYLFTVDELHSFAPLRRLPLVDVAITLVQNANIEKDINACQVNNILMEKDTVNKENLDKINKKENNREENRQYLLVENKGKRAAIMVHLEGINPEEFIDITPNDVTMLPGEKRKLQVISLKNSSLVNCGNEFYSLSLQGMNVLEKIL
jgi:beta-mannosidase